MTEERYLEWLERLEVPIEDTVSIEALQEYLKDMLGFYPTSGQLDALWGGTTFEQDILAPIGIRAVYVIYPWGSEIRFGVKGRPGLWGWESVLGFVEEEE